MTGTWFRYQNDVTRMIDMYRALVATSRWERDRGLRVTLVVRPLSLFLTDEHKSCLLRFARTWQGYMRIRCGMNCTECQLVPSYVYESEYFIRILCIMEFTPPATRYPTVWFSLSLT